MTHAPPPWNQQIAEPIVWFERFDKHYRPLGAERSLLAAYRAWKQAENSQKARESVQKRAKARQNAPRSVPSSWREAAVRWRWEARAAAWDAGQAAERRQAELQAIQKSREQRISLLNLTFNKALEAMTKVQTTNRPLGEVTNAIRVVVQELRHEYRLVEATAEKGQGRGTEGIPSWGDMEELPDEELALVLGNLLLAEGAQGDRPPTGIPVEPAARPPAEPPAESNK